MTCRKRTNELQVACEQKNAIVQTALDAVVGMGADGRITGWNSQAEQMFGYYDRRKLSADRMSETIIPETVSSPA